MVKCILIFFLSFCMFSCSKKPEQVAEAYFDKVTNKGDFESAWEMLAETQKRNFPKNDFEKKLKLFKDEKELYKYYLFVGKMTSFKPLGVKETGLNSSKVEIAYSLWSNSIFPEAFLQLTEKHKTTDPDIIFKKERILERKELAPFEDKIVLHLVKEGGEWKIDENAASIFKHPVFLGLYYKTIDENKEIKKHNDRVGNTRYAQVVANTVSGLMIAPERKVAIINCVIEKTGDITFAEVRSRYSEEEQAAIIRECN